MAKNQINPKENVDLINDSFTFYYHIKCLKIFSIKSTFDPKSFTKYMQSAYTWNCFGACFKETPLNECYDSTFIALSRD